MFAGTDVAARRICEEKPNFSTSGNRPVISQTCTARLMDFCHTPSSL